MFWIINSSVCQTWNYCKIVATCTNRMNLLTAGFFFLGGGVFLSYIQIQCKKKFLLTIILYNEGAIAKILCAFCIIMYYLTGNDYQIISVFQGMLFGWTAYIHPQKATAWPGDLQHWCPVCSDSRTVSWPRYSSSYGL